MVGESSIVIMDIVVVGEFWVSPNDDAYLTKSLVLYKVSVFKHFPSSSLSFDMWIE